MIPDVLKPAICPELRCDGRGWHYSKGRKRVKCKTCGGSGINPDMIVTREIPFNINGPTKWREIVIPLNGGTNG